MTTTTDHRDAIVPPSPQSAPRVCLAATRAGHAILDGGWWPRSADPVEELPGLALAIGKRYGPIRHIILNRDAWDSRPRRLAVGERVIRLGWFASVDPALLIATTEQGDQLDLLVVPADTAEVIAREALERAADPAGTARAPEVLNAARLRVRRTPHSV